MDTMETYYHYTTTQNAKAIIQSGVIRKSTKSARGRRDDARYGSGVYLTRVPPSTAKRYIALNNFDGASTAIQHMIAAGKSLTDDFYRAMLCIRGTSHGPVSVSVSVTSRSSTKTAERIWLVFGMRASFDLSYTVL